jgi:hypothetical protein
MDGKDGSRREVLMSLSSTVRRKEIVPIVRSTRSRGPSAVMQHLVTGYILRKVSSGDFVTCKHHNVYFHKPMWYSLLYI